MTSEFIPYAIPDIGDREIQAVADALKSGWLTSGPATAAFETEFADAVGGGVEAVAVSSATAGLHLALEACGVRSSDEVIVPTWTFTATAEVVEYLGAKPVLVDVDSETLNIDLNCLEHAITDKTRAIIVVHFAGQSVDMRALSELLQGRDIKVIEDAAHAFPSKTRGVVVGSCQFSDATVFSFYANKTMTTGEGGMITTRSAKVAARSRVMRLHGIDRDVFHRYSSNRPAWRYDVVAAGHKYNLADPAAAIGRVQLSRIEEMHSSRQAIADRYLAELADLPLGLPRLAASTEIHAWHVFSVRVEDPSPVDRDQLVERLSELGIGSSVHFIPLHFLSHWRMQLGDLESELPVATSEFDRRMSLPLYSKMSEEQVNRVIDALKVILT